MSGGSIQWDDTNGYLSKSKQSGSFPDGVYDHNTKIYYCCQDKGNWYDPIELPVDRPFYLLPQSGYTNAICQLVKGATSRLEYIDYDTADSIYLFGKLVTESLDRDVDDHVYFKHLEKTSRYMRVYYCYYKGN